MAGTGLTSEEVEEDIFVHVVEGGHVDTQGRGHTAHVEAEWLEQLQEIHLFACKWIVEFGTGPVALRPAADVHQLGLARWLARFCYFSPYTAHC